MLVTPKPGPVRGTPKPVLHSRTVWLNALTALAAGSAILGEALKLAFGVGLVLPEDITKWLLFAVGLVNVVLRLRTTQPVACSASCESAAAPLAPGPPVRELRRAAAGKR